MGNCFSCHKASEEESFEEVVIIKQDDPKNILCDKEESKITKRNTEQDHVSLTSIEKMRSGQEDASEPVSKPQAETPQDADVETENEFDLTPAELCLMGASIKKESECQPQAEVTYDADVTAESEVELTADLCITGTPIKKEPANEPQVEVPQDADATAENEVELTADLCITGTAINKEPVTQPEAEVTYDADVTAENEVEFTGDLCIKGTSIKEEPVNQPEGEVPKDTHAKSKNEIELTAELCITGKYIEKESSSQSHVVVLPFDAEEVDVSVSDTNNSPLNELEQVHDTLVTPDSVSSTDSLLLGHHHNYNHPTEMGSDGDAGASSSDLIAADQLIQDIDSIIHGDSQKFNAQTPKTRTDPETVRFLTSGNKELRKVRQATLNKDVEEINDEETLEEADDLIKEMDSIIQPSGSKTTDELRSKTMKGRNETNRGLPAKPKTSYAREGTTQCEGDTQGKQGTMATVNRSVTNTPKNLPAVNYKEEELEMMLEILKEDEQKVKKHASLESDLMADHSVPLPSVKTVKFLVDDQRPQTRTGLSPSAPKTLRKGRVTFERKFVLEKHEKEALSSDLDRADNLIKELDSIIQPIGSKTSDDLRPETMQGRIQTTRGLPSKSKPNNDVRGTIQCEGDAQGTLATVNRSVPNTPKNLHAINYKNEELEMMIEILKEDEQKVKKHASLESDLMADHCLPLRSVKTVKFLVDDQRPQTRTGLSPSAPNTLRKGLGTSESKFVPEKHEEEALSSDVDRADNLIKELDSIIQPIGSKTTEELRPKTRKRRTEMTRGLPAKSKTRNAREGSIQCEGDTEGTVATVDLSVKNTKMDLPAINYKEEELEMMLEILKEDEQKVKEQAALQSDLMADHSVPLPSVKTVKFLVDDQRPQTRTGLPPRPKTRRGPLKTKLNNLPGRLNPI